MGTEIWFTDGSSDIVTEPYEQVDKLLNPPAVTHDAKGSVVFPETSEGRSTPPAGENTVQVPPPSPAAPPRTDPEPERRTPPHKSAPPKVEAKSREEVGSKATSTG